MKTFRQKGLCENEVLQRTLGAGMDVSIDGQASLLARVLVEAMQNIHLKMRVQLSLFDRPSKAPELSPPHLPSPFAIKTEGEKN